MFSATALPLLYSESPGPCSLPSFSSLHVRPPAPAVHTCVRGEPRLLRVSLLTLRATCAGLSMGTLSTAAAQGRTPVSLGPHRRLAPSPTWGCRTGFRRDSFCLTMISSLAILLPPPFPATFRQSAPVGPAPSGWMAASPRCLTVSPSCSLPLSTRGFIYCAEHRKMGTQLPPVTAARLPRCPSTSLPPSSLTRYLLTEKLLSASPE